MRRTGLLRVGHTLSGRQRHRLPHRRTLVSLGALLHAGLRNNRSHFDQLTRSTTTCVITLHGGVVLLRGLARHGHGDSVGPWALPGEGHVLVKPHKGRRAGQGHGVGPRCPVRALAHVGGSIEIHGPFGARSSAQQARTAPGVHAVVAANTERRCESLVCGIRPGQRVHHGDHVTAVRDGAHHRHPA